MYAIALDVLPVFIMIFIGYAIVRFGVLRPEIGDALGEFVFNVSMPALLFRTLAEAVGSNLCHAAVARAQTGVRASCPRLPPA